MQNSLLDRHDDHPRHRRTAQESQEPLGTRAQEPDRLDRGRPPATSAAPVACAAQDSPRVVAIHSGAGGWQFTRDVTFSEILRQAAFHGFCGCQKRASFEVTAVAAGTASQRACRPSGARTGRRRQSRGDRGIARRRAPSGSPYPFLVERACAGGRRADANLSAFPNSSTPTDRWVAP
jgi:hypothetical protein